MANTGASPVEIVQYYQTKNPCYTNGRRITPSGIVVHSTGANNPMLRRYVQPVPDHPQREELLGLLGVNPYGNDWCNNARPDGRSVCVHAFIGKLDDGTVAAAQLLPFTIRAWHAGSGRLGSANHDYLSFELCEDAGNDPVYMEAAYRQAVRLSAFLCRQYGLDPAADGVVLSHREAYARGIASNHGDPESWWTRQNTPFTMERARQDIGKELEMDTLTYENFRA